MARRYIRDAKGRFATKGSGTTNRKGGVKNAWPSIAKSKKAAGARYRWDDSMGMMVPNLPAKARKFS